MNRSRRLGEGDGRDLAGSYSGILEHYLARGGEDALRSAYELGRKAFADGVGLLEMAAMHHATLAGVLARLGTAASLERDLDRAEQVFRESLCPYEMANRGFLEAVPALRRLNETLEREIQRIAHAVHDEAGQLLVAARLAMSGLAHDLSPSLRERLLEVGAILDRVEEELRRLSHELRPSILDDLGLVPALQFLAKGMTTRSELSIRVESSLEGRNPSNIETALYRIVQEALTNVTKHSRARNVKIQLARDATGLRCVIRDDGVGFDVFAVLSRAEQRGLGLVGIRERLNAIGGTLQISSEPSRGTELIVRIPVES